MILIVLGYGLAKGGMISPKTRAELVNLVLYVFLPCNILMSFPKGLTPDMIKQSLMVLLAASILQVIAFILNKVLYRWLPPGRQNILKYATITNNATVMGLSILSAVHGSIGVFLGSIYLIPGRIVLLTAGIALFTQDKKSKGAVRVLTHPCMIAVVLGFAYSFAPFELPVFLSDAIRWVGDITRVLPMIIVGTILCEVKPKEALDIHCFYYSFIRLFAIPAALFGILSLLRIEPMVISVSVLLASMPAATVTAMFAEKYDQDKAFASKTVFVSTVLSILTLPIMSAALNWLIHV